MNRLRKGEKPSALLLKVSYQSILEERKEIKAKRIKVFKLMNLIKYLTKRDIRNYCVIPTRLMTKKTLKLQLITMMKPLLRMNIKKINMTSVLLYKILTAKP